MYRAIDLSSRTCRAVAPGADTWELYRQDQTLESSTARIKYLRALAPGSSTWEA